MSNGNMCSTGSTASSNMPTLGRFYLLDILRGLASFAVLIWHYQHLYYRGLEKPEHFDRSIQPAFWLFRPFYLYGHLAVYLFFILSGFVFFYVYSDAITQRAISWKRFVGNRFSRLYPLHVLTLLIVAGLQILHQSWFGTYFVYAANDLKHFILQLFFVSFWGLEDDYSFNGPIWSVSIEILLYILFYIFCLFSSPRPLRLMLIAILGIIFGGLVNKYIGVGIFCFFLGGLIYQFSTCLHQRRSRRWLNFIPGVGLISMAIVFYISTYYLSRSMQIVFASMTFLPAIVLFVAWWQTKQPHAGRKYVLIGDLTYSSYLLHFPLQLCFHIIFLQTGWLEPSAVATLICYLVGTYALSYPTYFLFELPAKDIIRKVSRSRR